MGRSARLLWLIPVVVLALAIWYFFIKDFNYRLRFKTSQPIGMVYATLADRPNLPFIEKDSVIVNTKSPFEEVDYTIFKNDSIFELKWDLEAENDSTTLVTAYVKDVDHSFKQNLEVLFGKNDFVNSNISEAKNIMTYMAELGDMYKVSIVRDSVVSVEPKHCAYVSVNSTITGKAMAMYENIGIVMGFVRNNDLELNGDPFLKVNKLDLENNTINFDFCFPVKQFADMPVDPKVKFQKIPEFKAVKAVFNGNYRATEYAWFELMAHAQKEGFEYIAEPMEIYKNDPQSGTNSNEWIAEVYIPIKE